MFPRFEAERPAGLPMPLFPFGSKFGRVLFSVDKQAKTPRGLALRPGRDPVSGTNKEAVIAALRDVKRPRRVGDGFPQTVGEKDRRADGVDQLGIDRPSPRHRAFGRIGHRFGLDPNGGPG